MPLPNGYPLLKAPHANWLCEPRPISINHWLLLTHLSPLEILLTCVSRVSCLRRASRSFWPGSHVSFRCWFQQLFVFFIWFRSNGALPLPHCHILYLRLFDSRCVSYPTYFSDSFHSLYRPPFLWHSVCRVTPCLDSRLYFTPCSLGLDMGKYFQIHLNKQTYWVFRSTSWDTQPSCALLRFLCWAESLQQWTPQNWHIIQKAMIYLITTSQWLFCSSQSRRSCIVSDSQKVGEV